MFSSAVVEHARGAPGVFVEVVQPPGELLGVRLDLTAFVGVAPRGPSRLPERALRQDEAVASYLDTVPIQRSVPVAIESWSEYERWFGAFEGAGRLPYAVATYFAQGGRRARIVRIVHDDPTVAVGTGCAAACLAVAEPPPIDETSRYAAVIADNGALVRVRARDEGVWGDRLRATLRFVTRPLVFHDGTATGLRTSVTEWVPIGSLLRLTSSDGAMALRYVADSRIEADPGRPAAHRVVDLDVATGAAPASVEIVTAVLDVVDDDPRRARSERIAPVGLSSAHPRWLARVLIDESTLLWPAGAWTGASVALTDPSLPDLLFASSDAPAVADVVAGDLAPVDPEHLVEAHLAGGADRSAEVVPEDFFDPDWVPGDEGSASGVHCLYDVADVGLLVAPDLYDPAPLVGPADITDPIGFGGPAFAPCVRVVPAAQRVAIAPLAGLRLDPADAADRRQIVELQLGLVTFAELTGRMTALLDVPLGLSRRQITEWRAEFDTSCAAGYHPWLDVAAPDDDREALIRLNPSAFAAGVIAACEIRNGIVGGPANRMLVHAVRAATAVGPDEHDELHDDGINVSVLERDGLRLTGARTLSRRADLRQLNVARLITAIGLTLEREMAWAVFEPNHPYLWAEVTRMIGDHLERLHRAGALVGATPSESFFVHCDETTMTRNDLDNGRLVAVIGIAPSEPIEYIVLRLALDGIVSVRIEGGHV